MKWIVKEQFSLLRVLRMKSNVTPHGQRWGSQTGARGSLETPMDLPVLGAQLCECGRHSCVWSRGKWVTALPVLKVVGIIGERMGGTRGVV